MTLFKDDILRSMNLTSNSFEKRKYILFLIHTKNATILQQTKNVHAKNYIKRANK